MPSWYASSTASMIASSVIRCTISMPGDTKLRRPCMCRITFAGVNTVKLKQRPSFSSTKTSRLSSSGASASPMTRISTIAGCSIAILRMRSLTEGVQDQVDHAILVALVGLAKDFHVALCVFAEEYPTPVAGTQVPDAGRELPRADTGIGVAAEVFRDQVVDVALPGLAQALRLSDQARILADPSDQPEAGNVGAERDLALAHQLGEACLLARPERSIVDPLHQLAELRCFGLAQRGDCSRDVGRALQCQGPVQIREPADDASADQAECPEQDAAGDPPDELLDREAGDHDPGLLQLPLGLLEDVGVDLLAIGDVEIVVAPAGSRRGCRRRPVRLHEPESPGLVPREVDLERSDAVHQDHLEQGLEVVLCDLGGRDLRYRRARGGPTFLARSRYELAAGVLDRDVDRGEAFAVGGRDGLAQRAHGRPRLAPEARLDRLVGRRLLGWLDDVRRARGSGGRSEEHTPEPQAPCPNTLCVSSC